MQNHKETDTHVETHRPKIHQCALALLRKAFFVCFMFQVFLCCTLYGLWWLTQVHLVEFELGPWSPCPLHTALAPCSWPICYVNSKCSNCIACLWTDCRAVVSIKKKQHRKPSIAVLKVLDHRCLFKLAHCPWYFEWSWKYVVLRHLIKMGPEETKEHIRNCMWLGVHNGFIQ